MYKNRKESEKTYGEFGFYFIVILSLLQGLLHGFKLSSFKRSNLFPLYSYRLWQCCGGQSSPRSRDPAQYQPRQNILAQWASERIMQLCLLQLCPFLAVCAVNIQPLATIDLGGCLRLQISPPHISIDPVNTSSLRPFYTVSVPHLSLIVDWLHRQKWIGPRIVHGHPRYAIRHLSTWPDDQHLI